MNALYTTRFGAPLKTFVLALGLASAAQAAEDYTQWSKSRKYTINTSATGSFWEGTATGFPLLVRIASGDTVLTQAKAGGADIRFTKADGVTRLKHEIETWGTSGAAIWVLVDTVKGNTAQQVFQMYWGKADAADSSQGAAVFSPANGYVGVWHMGGNANETDVTGNGNTAVATGAPGSAAGHIGGARTLARASSQHFVVADHASLNWTTPGLTLSAWVKAADWEGSTRIFQKGPGGDAAQWGLRETSLDRLAIDVNATNLNDATSAVPPTETWALVHAVVDGTARKIYLDGFEVASAEYPGGDLATSTEPLYIGRRSDDASPHYFNGAMDELRVQKVGRSPEWIALEYQSQKSGPSLVQVVPEGGIISVAADRVRDARRFSVTARAADVVFRVEDAVSASVAVTDMRGTVVWSGAFPAGSRELAWNASGSANGVYVARLQARDVQGKVSVVERRITLAR